MPTSVAFGALGRSLVSRSSPDDKRAMEIADYLIGAGTVGFASDELRPLMLVDLDRWPVDADLALPSCPLIGFGRAAHPLATHLDAMIEAPVTAGRLIEAIERAPRAAAALVDLLRSIDRLRPGAALSLESMCLAMLQGSAEHAAWLQRQAPAPEAAPGTVIVERRDDVLRITLARPWAHNAIDRGMRDALYEAFVVAALDRDVRCVRLRGSGATFSVGADLAEFGTTRDPATAHAIRMRTLPALALASRAGRFEVHVQGGCVGSGLELAAFADRITATRNAWFQLPELGMGIIPGAGGCVSLPRRIGRQRAALMILSGRRIGASTALRWGLIDAIVDAPPGDEGGADEV